MSDLNAIPGRAGLPTGLCCCGLTAHWLAWACAVALILTAGSVQAAGHAPAPDVISADSPYDVPTTVAHLKAAIVARQYRIVRIQSGQTGTPSAAPGPTIVYFCNFRLLHEAFLINKGIGPMLPCRIVVSRENGRTRLYAPNLKTLGKAFIAGSPELKRICEMVTHDYRDMLDEATM